MRKYYAIVLGVGFVTSFFDPAGVVCEFCGKTPVSNQVQVKGQMHHQDDLCLK